MKTEKKNDLVLGVRYWLDGHKDISGVFCGTIANNCEGFYFNKIEGDGYIRNETKEFGVYIGFNRPTGFTKIDQ